MNAVAIQYIWQAILESERSDDLPFIDALKRLSQPQSDQSGAPRCASIATATLELRPTAALPLLSRP